MPNPKKPAERRLAFGYEDQLQWTSTNNLSLQEFGWT